MAADFGGLLAKAKAPPALAATPALPEPDGDEDGMTERMTPIAQDLMDAIRGGDVGSVADALIAAHRAANAGPSEAGLPGEGMESPPLPPV